jgi:hypothetical protein
MSRRRRRRRKPVSLLLILLLTELLLLFLPKLCVLFLFHLVLSLHIIKDTAFSETCDGPLAQLSKERPIRFDDVTAIFHKDKGLVEIQIL